ncbi:hypothetical protein BH09BAC1_BH09BAC1_23980 [soil metagenome]
MIIPIKKNRIVAMAHNPKYCVDLKGITEIKVSDNGVCEECVKIGSEWVHLRTCQTCGANHCCDNSPNRHATRHYLSSKHPVMASAESAERWMWCYEHNFIRQY